LVAKAFRAEKLYSTVNSSRAERLTNMASLAEAASDIRAREWQRSHYQLRTVLNDLLSLGNSNAIVKEVNLLREQFLLRANENLRLVEKGAEELIETSRRHEFAHIFKISAELIRHKAQAQACRVIADELAAVLDASNANVEKTSENASPAAALHEASVVRSNVVQLRHRVALGQRKS
jgi:Mn-dependent DtxR family transcriptional regulator